MKDDKKLPINMHQIIQSDFVPKNAVFIVNNFEHLFTKLNKVVPPPGVFFNEFQLYNIRSGRLYPESQLMEKTFLERIKSISYIIKIAIKYGWREGEAKGFYKYKFSFKHYNTFSIGCISA